MKNIYSLILFYCGLFTFSIILNSCCSDPNKVTIIGGGEIIFIEQQELPISGNFTATTLTGLPFSMSTEMEIDIAANFIQQGFMSPVYGLSCEDEYQNALVDSSFSLTCDTDFIYNEEVVVAGTHFGDLEGIVVLIHIQSMLVSVEQVFMDRVKFNNGENIFRMKIRTSDGLEVESIGEVEIDIE